jgi:septation ring formation regulator EzrA
MTTISEIQNTTETLTRLEAELSDLSAKMTLAANDADSASMIALRHRADDLPIEIKMTRIRLARLHLQRNEEILPELQTEIEKLYKPMEEARIAYSEAGKVLNLASSEYQNAVENSKEKKRRIGEQRREIEALIHEKPAKPIVQSLLMSGAR